MFPVSPNAYNASVVTDVETNEDSTLAVSFVFGGTSTTVTMPAGTIVKPGDMVTTFAGASHVNIIPCTPILPAP